MKKRLFFASVFALLLGSALPMDRASAQEILTFDFASLAGNEVTADSNTNNSGLTASVISRGSGLTASANGGRFNATSWAITSIENAVVGNDYMEFTITPTAGNKFTVTTIVVQWQRSSTGNVAIALRSSVDGYATDIDGVKSVVDSTSTQTFTWTVNQTESLAAVTYRFYSYAETTAGSGGPGDGTGNDIIVNGAVTSASPDAPVITSPTTASGTAYESFSYQIEASNSPTSFDATGLPDGLSVDTATGLISGTPTAVGTTNVTISATNADGTGSEVLTLTIAKNPGAPTITSSLTAVGQTGASFSYQIEATNSPTSFALVGTLPTGLVFDEVTGTITGTPETSVSRNVTISATNALGTDSQTLNIFTGSAPALVNPFGAAYAGATMSVQILASGPATSYSAPDLPAGLTLDPATGLITGSLSTAGSNVFEVTVANPLGSASADFTLTILDQAAQNAIPLNVVVNKYLNSAPDRVQLLVVGDGTPGSTVDMRGMVIKDFSSSNANDGGGKFIFADDPVWEAVPAGTLIDLLGPGALFPETPFVDPDNFYIAARLQDATAFVPGGGSFEIGANDMVMIKAAGTGISGVAGGIHALCAGSAGAQYTAFLGAKIKGGNAAPSAVALNSTSQLSDYGVSGGAASTDVSVTTPEIDLNFESWNNATNEIFIQTLRGVVDGTGSAVVRNATLGSSFSGQNLFARSSSGQTVAIDFTPTSTTTQMSAIAIEVPVSFGVPSAANVTLSGAGSESATVAVSGQVITIEALALVNPDTITISIAGLTTPDTSASITDTGAYEFPIQSQGQGGALAPLAASPAAQVVVPIANVRNVDPSTFVPVLLGQTVAVEGVCSVGRLGGGNTNSALQDATHGVTIYSLSAVTGPQTRGNRYAVVGTIEQFNGLVQLNLSDPDLVIDLGPEVDPAPITVSVAEFNANGVEYQSRVVRIENLSYVSGTWGVNQNITLQDGSGNQVTIRIQSNSTATTEPASYPVTITGIGGQFDNASPYDTGFQLQPRDADDVVGQSAPAYDTWANSFGLDPAVTTGPTAGAPAADPDGDSFSNAEEYAFGTNPTEGNGSLLSSTASGGNLTVTWLERADVTYNVQSTANLTTTAFANDGTVTVENGPTEPAPPAGYTRKQFTVPASGQTFYRVTGTTSP
jgi:hypothetical protein